MVAVAVQVIGIVVLIAAVIIGLYVASAFKENITIDDPQTAQIANDVFTGLIGTFSWTRIVVITSFAVLMLSLLWGLMRTREE